MARATDLTDCEIDRLIVEHCGASVVVFTGPDAPAARLTLSTGGFSCLLAKAPPLGDEARFTLRLPGADTLSGTARVTGGGLPDTHEILTEAVEAFALLVSQASRKLSLPVCQFGLCG